MQLLEQFEDFLYQLASRYSAIRVCKIYQAAVYVRTRDGMNGVGKCESSIDVSLVMPLRNGEKYLGDTVRSVLAQTHSNWELFLIDDGSSDGTERIAADFVRMDRRIKRFRQDCRGRACARNVGLAFASGAFVAFFDQDDLWCRRKLERQLQQLRSHPVDVLFSDSQIFEDGAPTVRRFGTITGAFSGQEMANLLFAGNRIPLLTALIRRQRLLEVGPLREEREFENCDDYELWLRLATRGASFYGMDEPLARYRIHETQGSRDMLQNLRAELAVLELYRDARVIAEETKLLRLRKQYRSLISTLVVQNLHSEAPEYIEALRDLESSRFAYFIERVTFRCAPRLFSFVGRAFGRLERYCQTSLSTLRKVLCRN